VKVYPERFQKVPRTRKIPKRKAPRISKNFNQASYERSEHPHRARKRCSLSRGSFSLI